MLLCAYRWLYGIEFSKAELCVSEAIQGEFFGRTGFGICTKFPALSFRGSVR